MKPKRKPISPEERKIRKLNRELRAGIHNKKIVAEIIKLRRTLGKHTHSWVFDSGYGASYCSICGHWDRN